MAKKEPYVPPPNPDFAALAESCRREWERDAPSLVAFDTETEGLAFFDPAFCATLQWPGGSPHYLEFPEHKGLLSEILRSADTWVGHNIKFDIQKVILAGVVSREDVYPERIHDTEALAHLDDEHREKKLKSLAVSVLGHEDNVEVVTKTGPNAGAVKLVPRETHELNEVRRKLGLTQKDGYHLLPRAVILPYALKDAEFTLSLYEALRSRVEAHKDLWQLYLQEMSLTCTLIDMEIAGLGVIPDYIDTKVKEYAKLVLQDELDIERIVQRPVGKNAKAGEFNPGSNPQLHAYFTEVGHPSDSYDADHLAKIDHPLAEKLLEYRDHTKMLSTYFLPMQDEQQEGILHPSFRQHGTVTGRMSAGKERG